MDKFIQTIHEPQGKKHQRLFKMQGLKKEGKCYFGVLQTCFEIILDRQWYMATINNTLIRSMILHNWITKYPIST